MRDIEIIVIKIQQFLNAIEQTNQPDYAELAESYAEICDDINRRLEKCREEILRNSPETAIYLAEQEPPLLEMINIINFDRLEEWNELCELYNWRRALPVDEKLVAELKKCYGNHTALKPLLLEYRKKSKNAGLKEKIALLRKIKAVDSDNAQWEDDLSRFENERLHELKKIGRKAIEENDEITIRSVYDEITAPGWFVSPPSNVVSKLRNELMAFKKMRMEERGKKILHSLANAYSTYNVQDLAVALRKWDMLLKESCFSPDEASEKQVEEARKWLDSENEQMEKERVFHKLTRQLADDMENRKSLPEIDNLYHKLMEFDMPIPDYLLARYKQVRSDMELDAKRLYTKRLVVSLVFIFAILAFLAYFIHLRIKESEYKKWSAPILKASHEYNLTGLKAAMQSIEKLKSEHPDFYDTEIVKAESTIHSLISQINEEQRQCRNVLERLDAIAADDYKDYNKMDELIQRAEILLKKLNDKDGLLHLDTIRKTKKAYEIRTQDERDLKFREDGLALNKQLMLVETVDPECQPEEFDQALNKYEKAANQLLERKGVNPDIYKKYSITINDTIRRLNKVLSDSKERVRQKNELLETIETEKLNLPSYNLALQRFVNKFPEDKRSMEFMRILKMMPAYLNVIALQHLSPESLDKKGIQKYAEFLRTHPGKNIWRRDLKEFLVAKLIYLDNKDTVFSAIKALKNLQVMKYRVLRFENQQGDKIYFYTDDAVDRKISSINRRTFATLRTKVMENDIGNIKKEYFFQQTGDGWDVIVGRKRVYRNLKALDNLQKTLPLAAHSIFCRDLNIEIAGASPEEYEEVLVKQIYELKKNSEINSFLKLQLLQRLYSLAEKISINNKTVLRAGALKLQQLLQACENVNWVSLDSRTKMRIDAVIAALPKLYGQVENDALKFKILKIAVGRRLKEVGVVAVGSDGKVELTPLADGTYHEVWALKERNGVLKFYIAGKKDITGVELFPEARKMLMDGEPVFSPSDGRSTREQSDKTVRLGGDIDSLRMPDSWPNEL